MASSHARALDRMKLIEQNLRDLESDKQEAKTLLDSLRQSMQGFRNKRRELRQQGVIDHTDQRVEKLNKDQDALSESLRKGEELLIDIMQRINDSEILKARIQLSISHFLPDTNRG